MVVGNQIKDLSVQVHPDDEYGMAHSHMRGKPESEWLLGDGEGTMILGHHAKTKEEFIKLAENKEWDKLLRKIKVKGEILFIFLKEHCMLHKEKGAVWLFLPMVM